MLRRSCNRLFICASRSSIDRLCFMPRTCSHLKTASFHANPMEKMFFSSYDLEEAKAAEDEIDAQTTSLLADQYSDTHKVALIEPFFCGRLRIRRVRSITSSSLRQAEGRALIESVPGWHVEYTCEATVRSTGTAALFTSGVLKDVTRKVPSSCDTIFLNVAQLNGNQLSTLSQAWAGRRVIDRYTLVLLIFWARARTREARLQVALAEIPILRSRLLDTNRPPSILSGARIHSGDSVEQIHSRFLEERSAQLRHELHRIEELRLCARANRKRRAGGIPTVAMVGYTNAGKTSLIGAFCGCGSAVPQNRLFATLDSSSRVARLSDSGITVVLVDTVGFIQDLPTDLVASFRATLADTLAADLLIHVIDLSHADAPAQVAQVRATLDHLFSQGRNQHRGGNNLNESSAPCASYRQGLADGRIIEVGNKADLATIDTIENFLAESADRLVVACRPRSADSLVNLDLDRFDTRFGMTALRDQLSQTLQRLVGYRRHRIAVPMGSHLYTWLRRHAIAVQAEEVHPHDSTKVVLTLLLTETCLSQMRATFPPRKAGHAELTFSPS